MNVEKEYKTRDDCNVLKKKAVGSNIVDCRDSFVRQRQIINNISQYAVAQKYSENQSHDFGTVMYLAAAREKLKKYSPSYLSKNVASSITYYGIDDDDIDMDGLSCNSMHAEIAVYLQELEKDNTPRSIAIATERKPCSVQGGCKEFFKKKETEQPGFEFYMEYLVNDDNDAPATLYSFYRELDPQIDYNERLEKALKSAKDEPE